MKLSTLIYKLEQIKNSNRYRNIDVFVELNCENGVGNRDFNVYHHYHEANTYKGIKQPEINQVILMPHDKDYSQPEYQVPMYMSVKIPIDFYEEEDWDKYEPVKKFVEKTTKTYGKLEIFIDLKEHKILDWDENCHETHLFEKVVDRGIYILYGKEWNEITRIESYVPNKCLPEKDGFGDYLTLDIDNKVVISNWYDNPDFKELYEDN